MILDADSVVGMVLGKANDDLASLMAADVLFLKASMAPPVDDEIRIAVDELSTVDEKKSKLVVVVETNGGYIEVVERIVRVFRNHYDLVEFVVPGYAYSAGTVLVMSGDEIHMDYHSILGPIDPQFESENGEYVPGMGYLAKYEELVKTINNAHDISEVRAEVAYLVQKFDPAKLYHIEQAIEHSKSLLRDWLPKYKFKDWDATEANGTPVTQEMKEQRANAIAETLGEVDRWHSHGRGITFSELTSDAIKLKVCDYGQNAELSKAIRGYYSLMVDYLGKRGWTGGIHTKCGLRRAR